MNSRYLVLALPLLFLMIGMGYASTTMLLNTSNNGILADSYIDAGYGNNNYGNEDGMYIGGAGGFDDMRAILKFNMSLIPAGSTIDSASIGVCVGSSGMGTTKTWTFYNTTTNWTEDNVTWNNQPTYDSVGGSISFSGLGTCYEVNITSIAVGAYNNSDNLSVMIRETIDSGSTWKMIWAKEYSSEPDRPYLNITYGVPAPNNTAPTMDYVYANSDSNGFHCGGNTTDAENATLAVETRWYINDTLSDDFNYTINVTEGTLTPFANVSKNNLSQSQSWKCEARAFDGLNYSSWVNSSALETGVAPSVTSISVERNISGDLDCHVTAVDDTASNISIYYTWFNGTIEYSNGSVSVGNNSDTIVTTLPYTTTSLYDNWTCVASPSDDYFTGASVNASYYFANYPPIIVYVKANQSTGLDCYVLLYDNETSDLQADVKWYRGDAYVSAFDSTTNVTNGTETLVGNVPYENITNRQSWKCGVRGYDFVSYTDWVNSSVVNVVKNTAPTITTIEMIASGGLYCQVTAVDAENLTMTAEAWYFKNGVHVFAYDTISTIINNTLMWNIGIVHDNDIGNGEIWNCQVKVSDGINTTAFSTSNKYSTLSDAEAKNTNTTSGLVGLAVVGIIVAVFVVLMMAIKK